MSLLCDLGKRGRRHLFNGWQPASVPGLMNSLHFQQRYPLELTDWLTGLITDWLTVGPHSLACLLGGPTLVGLLMGSPLVFVDVTVGSMSEWFTGCDRDAKQSSGLAVEWPSGRVGSMTRWLTDSLARGPTGWLARVLTDGRTVKQSSGPAVEWPRGRVGSMTRWHTGSLARWLAVTLAC